MGRLGQIQTKLATFDMILVTDFRMLIKELKLVLIYSLRSR